MNEKKESARSRCNSSRAMVSTSQRDTDIVANGWTRAQCRAIGLVFCGWFAAMAILEVVF